MDDREAALPPSPWNQGELAVQTEVGVAQRMGEIGRRVVRDYMPDEHRAFFAQLPFVVVGAVDRDGTPWATLLSARPGFLASPDAKTLSVKIGRDILDPAEAGLEDGDAVGLLGIGLDNRRRNRMNGRLHRNASGFDVHVEQSFGNCPQYIQLRDARFVREPDAPSTASVEALSGLDAEACATIRSADTFFVASYADDGGWRQVDVSHRGGKAGFVRIENGVLTIPDFAGNFFFATLGNIHLNGKAGLVFPNFLTGDLLQLSGDAELVMSGPDIGTFSGAERFWRFRPRKLMRRRDAMPLRWTFRPEGWSPYVLSTGDWDEAAVRLRASKSAKAWRRLRVDRIVDESPTVRSFYLGPIDAEPLALARPGQHVPIRAILPNGERPLSRTYTLSSGAGDGEYRISVKRDGVVSAYLHDQIRPGDLLEVRAPTGDFVLDVADTGQMLLVAAGVGITPAIAMLRSLVLGRARSTPLPPAHLIYAVRSRRDRAFLHELADLTAESDGALTVTWVLSAYDDEQPLAENERPGRLNAALLRELLPPGDFNAYVCGPPGFMQSVYDGLRDVGVPDARIHAEAFGPSILKRRPDPGAAPISKSVPENTPVIVGFITSGKQACWTPAAGSLLDLAEASGLNPDYGCRAGSCGTCRTTILKGKVAYPTPPGASIRSDEALICIGVPAEGEDGQPAIVNLAL